MHTVATVYNGPLFQLSHYLDIVEVEIARQISSQSEAFFEAMTSHDELQDYLANTKNAVQYLRSGFQVCHSADSGAHLTLAGAKLSEFQNSLV